MLKIAVYSALLTLGFVLSQLIPSFLIAPAPYFLTVKVATMFCLSFIMIHVGYEFDLDKTNLRQYGVDYMVAATAAAFPWLLCAAYFFYVVNPAASRGDPESWQESLVVARFAAPTSAGVLFAMLAAAGLAGSWVFKKARILAIFDDLDTIVLMVPLQMVLVGLRWQLGVMVSVMVILLLLAWKFLHKLKISMHWYSVLFYSATLTAFAEVVYYLSLAYDADVPLHLEVLMPAFVLGCLIARPKYQEHGILEEGHEYGPETAQGRRAGTIVSASFMVLVGLSMPPIDGGQLAGADAADPWSFWGMILLHVIAITLLSNLGKMAPAFCYRNEATLHERLALAVGMFPRGEVGAGVLIISLSYGFGGRTVMIAMLSLALNLLLTGPVIAAVKWLIARRREIVA